MTKKHFIAVAKMISEKQGAEKNELADWFADFFAKYNKLFNGEKFRKTCGVESVRVVKDEEHGEEYIRAEKETFMLGE